MPFAPAWPVRQNVLVSGAPNESFPGKTRRPRRVAVVRVMCAGFGLAMVVVGALDRANAVTPWVGAVALFLGLAVGGLTQFVGSRPQRETSQWVWALVGTCGAVGSTLLAMYASGSAQDVLLIFFGAVLVSIVLSLWLADRAT